MFARLFITANSNPSPYQAWIPQRECFVRELFFSHKHCDRTLMLVTVKAYDSANHYLGCDQAYVTLPDDGGGKPGGDPLPE